MAFDETGLRPDRDVALAECARAAVSWHSPLVTADKKLASIRRGMAWAARVNDGTLPARTVGEFLALLRRPTEWLPDFTGGPLADETGASEFAEDIVAETGGPNADAEAEVVQARVGAARKVFATRVNGDAEYTTFRRFIIEHGHATVDEAQAGLLVAGMAPPDLFEAIPPSCCVSSACGTVFYPCPRCRWPMIRRDNIIECTSTICRSDGARFQQSGSSLMPLGKRKPSIAVPENGRLRLHRGAWRYTLQPGLVELDLYTRLRRMPGVSVELWPELDNYDLRLRTRGSTWLVDVKDWSCAPALAKHFLRNDRTELLYVVLPNWRSDQLVVLKDRCQRLKLRFYTVKKFVAMVRSESGENRSLRENARG